MSNDDIPNVDLSNFYNIERRNTERHNLKFVCPNIECQILKFYSTYLPWLT
jgi:hypothetical protein